MKLKEILFIYCVLDCIFLVCICQDMCYEYIFCNCINDRYFFWDLGVGGGCFWFVELGWIFWLYGLFCLFVGWFERVGYFVLYGDEWCGLGVSDYLWQCVGVIGVDFQLYDDWCGCFFDVYLGVMDVIVVCFGYFYWCLCDFCGRW